MPSTLFWCIMQKLYSEKQLLTGVLPIKLFWKISKIPENAWGWVLFLVRLQNLGLQI